MDQRADSNALGPLGVGPVLRAGCARDVEVESAGFVDELLEDIAAVMAPPASASISMSAISTMCSK